MILSSCILVFYGMYHILFSHSLLLDISIFLQFFTIINDTAMFIFVHKSQCASMIVPSGYVPRSEIPWWEGLDSFNKVLPNCPPERAIYSPTSRIRKGLIFVIYKGILETFQSRQTGTGISLGLWLTQDHQPESCGILLNVTLSGSQHSWPAWSPLAVWFLAELG